MAEKILRAILNQRKDLDEQKLLSLIATRKEQAGGLLSEQGAAMLVAQDLHVEMQRVGMEDIRIQNLVTGLSDVSVVGRVTNLQPLQEFKRQGGAIGRVVRFQLVDSTGRINCSAWDKAAENVGKRDIEGSVIRIAHAYTREGLPGTAELHIGDKSLITTDPTNVPDEKVPNLETLFATIEEARRSSGDVSVSGVVKTPPRIVSFKRGDGEGKLLRAKLIDKTGRITFVAWNEKASELEALKKGDAVQISGARLKAGLDGQPEIHIDTRSQVVVLPFVPEALQNLTTTLTKIKEIGPNKRDIDVLANVLKIEPHRELLRQNGEKTKVANLLLGDETGIIAASFWDDKAELSVQLKEGSAVLIEEATSREWRGEISLTVGRSSYVTGNQGGMLKTEGTPTKLKDIIEKSGSVIVEGVVIESPTHRQVQTAKGETVDLTEMRLKDDSAERRVTFWRKQAQEAMKFLPGSRIRITGLLPRRGLTEEIELSSGSITFIEMLQTAEISQPNGVTRIAELKEGVRQTIQAQIIEIMNKSYASLNCKVCGGQAEFDDESLLCEKCGLLEDADVSATLFLGVKDETGVIGATLNSPQSNVLIGEDSKWIKLRLTEQQAPKIQLSLENLSKVIGTRIVMTGTANRDAQSGTLTLHPDKVELITTNKKADSTP